MKRIDEEFVQNKVESFLKAEDFISNREIRELWEHGVDLKLKHKHYGRYYLIECKGEPGSRGPVKSFWGSVSSSINSAVGQIVSRMHTKRRSRYGGYNFGLGFPVSFKEKVIRKIPYYVCKNLKLRLFFIKKNGEVEKIEPKQLEKIQRNKNAK